MQKFLINEFEGPLDLLLHLIKQSKMDIYEIKLVDITVQYLKYIKDMEDLNLDIASEYLVMAAELIEMKSRYLLPKQILEEESDYIENPEDELKRRLLEYKKYKDNSIKFKELEENRKQYFTKVPESFNSFSDNKLINNNEISVFDLLEAFKKILDKQEYLKPLNTKITKKELSVNERIDKIRDVLKKHNKVSFVSLFEELTKPYVIVTFLSILEMSKRNEIILKQDNNFDEIYIERV